MKCSFQIYDGTYFIHAFYIIIVIMAKSLEKMGIAGRVFLQEALTNTTDPLGAIEDFQRENSILLPSLRPALPLLGKVL